MKKITIVLWPLLSIIAFAFTTLSTESVKQTSYIWFKVKLNVHIPCNNFTSVKPSDLEIVVPTATTAVADLTAAGFSLTQSQAVTAFGCPIVQTEVCAVGYARSDFNFETIIIDGVAYWIPKPTATVLTKVCRPTP